MAEDEDKYRGRGYDRGQEAEQKQVEIMEDMRDKDKEVNQAARKSDDALVCCVENTIEDRIMNSSASFHDTYCKEELERFKLRFGKVRLADDTTLDIAGVGDVVLKTNFGTSWTLKDVRYISGLIRRLISVGQLDGEGYGVGFGDQQWKVTKEEAFFYNIREDKETVETVAGVAVGIMQTFRIVMLKMVSETPLQFGFAKRLSQTFREESMGLRAEAPEILWADSVFGCDSFVKVKDICGEAMKCTFIDSGSDEMRYSFQDTKSHQLDIPENLVENDSIVTEYGLSSKITQSLGGSLDTSEGSKIVGASRIVEDEMKNTLKIEHPARREALRLHRCEDPPESPGIQKEPDVFLSQIISRKEGITKIVDVQGERRAEWQEKEPSYVGALNDTSTQHKSEGFQLAGQEENLECRLKEILSRTEATVDDMLVAGSDMAEFNKSKW
nr:hypothetical protein [Tanacetum cinerariifolium]